MILLLKFHYFAKFLSNFQSLEVCLHKGKITFQIIVTLLIGLHINWIIDSLCPGIANIYIVKCQKLNLNES